MTFVKHSAFTILELVLVIAVMVMLTILIVSVTTSLRMANRDNKRVTDIKQIQSGLEMYYRDYGLYPTSLSVGSPIIGDGRTYLNTIPSNPVPNNDGTCANNANYAYTSDANRTSYHIDFCLGARTADVGPGNNDAVPGDIITCIPDCYMSCNYGLTGTTANNGSDGCGATCANAVSLCPTNYSCSYNHCMAN
ncbi:MAG: type II secretion system protein [Candidatus Falkowbacteria bacterium]